MPIVKHFIEKLSRLFHRIKPISNDCKRTSEAGKYSRKARRVLHLSSTDPSTGAVLANVPQILVLEMLAAEMLAEENQIDEPDDTTTMNIAPNTNARRAILPNNISPRTVSGKSRARGTKSTVNTAPNNIASETNAAEKHGPHNKCKKKIPTNKISPVSRTIVSKKTAPGTKTPNNAAPMNMAPIDMELPSTSRSHQVDTSDRFTKTEHPGNNGDSVNVDDQADGGPMLENGISRKAFCRKLEIILARGLEGHRRYRSRFDPIAFKRNPNLK